MPIHDWTRVIHGVFHDFHHEWISTIKRAMNAGRLPEGYYALAEQIAGGLGPDVLTLEGASDAPSAIGGNGAIDWGARGGLAVAVAPPRVRYTATTELDTYVRKRSRVVIRHASGHRVVAMIEIVSAGNKSSEQALHAFVSKAAELLDAGIHLLILDLFPPGRRDPQGIHGAIWEEIEAPDFQLPEDKPLTLAAYSAGAMTCAYVEPVAVGDTLPDMPLFLEPDIYVPVPLAESYQAAWEAVPRYWQDQLSKPAT
jgi:hypothetical protein